MDVLSILHKIGFDGQIFLFNMINFAIVALLLYLFVFKKMSTMLAERQKILQEGVENTSKSKTLINEAEQQAQSVVAEARRKAQHLLELAEKHAADQEAKLVEQARLRAQEIVTEAENNAQTLVDKKVQEFNAQSVGLVVEAAKKLTEEKELTSEKL